MELRASRARLGRMVRAVQWWDFKLIPIFSIFYATALVQHVPVTSMWPAVIGLLLAIAPGAAYVSVINDITDRADDRRAGKVNRLAGKPSWLLTLLVAAPVTVGVVFTFLWRDDGLLVSAYLCAWAAFSLYSLPPFRLKSRAGLGIIADASGAHLFPTLVAILLSFRATGQPVDYMWLAAAGVWAFACGLRGILWHQLADLENDRKAGVQTFVVRYSAPIAVRLANYLAFPVELAALALLLWRMQSVFPVLSLLLYAIFVALKAWLWRIRLVIAEPRERHSIVGQEFYNFFFPLGILTACVLFHPVDWMILVAHLLIFPAPAISVAAASGWCET